MLISPRASYIATPLSKSSAKSYDNKVDKGLYYFVNSRVLNAALYRVVEVEIS
jgi:hypothetical protein